VTFSSELHHKYNVRFIQICKDDEVRVICDFLLGAASQVQISVLSEKDKSHSESRDSKAVKPKTPYSKKNQVQINLARFRTADKSARTSGPKELNGYKITWHSEANLSKT
jgi:hypothetical protein